MRRATKAGFSRAISSQGDLGLGAAPDALCSDADARCYRSRRSSPGLSDERPEKNPFVGTGDRSAGVAIHNTSQPAYQPAAPRRAPPRLRQFAEIVSNGDGSTRSEYAA